MAEVEEKRYAGPFDDYPYDYYVQSPIGLVPKTNNKTRLIFHLSYDFKLSGNRSINAHIPKDKCSVKYKDLDYAVRACLKLLKEEHGWPNKNKKTLWFAKSDLKSAFRILGLCSDSWPLLVLKAVNSTTGQTQYFVDKCLPFEASISCALFQRFSDALKHIFEYETGCTVVTNYLDDFLFIAKSEHECNYLVNRFLQLCRYLQVPVSLDKTEWATTRIVFLGILLDGLCHVLVVREEKRIKAVNMLKHCSSKKKVTVLAIQQLAGTLNFLSRAIYLGRAFIRSMYDNYKGFVNVAKLGQHKYQREPKSLKPHHHIAIDKTFREDCAIWIKFLEPTPDITNLSHLLRPFVDLTTMLTATELKFFSDASANVDLGFGCYYDKKWTYGKWNEFFFNKHKPHIEFLELYALCVAVFTWSEQLRNKRIVLFCDNEAVVNMVNNQTSKEKSCLVLIKKLIFRELVFNMRIFVRHIFGKSNEIANAISRFQWTRFKKVAPSDVSPTPEPLTDELWPMWKVWED